MKSNKDKLITIERALFSCWDKSGIAALAAELWKRGVEIVSSGGTAEQLLRHNIPVLKVEEMTGFPEILDGRVKTLHPFIHGAILARRTPEHLSQLKKNGILPIDLLVVNLYPFLDREKKQDHTVSQMIELIDIGGPAMLRAAAKNYRHVIALHKPDQYQAFLEVWRKNNRRVPVEYARQWAADAFFYTAYYDSRVAAYLDGQSQQEKLPSRFSRFYIKRQNLRYGENPHQAAALYSEFDSGKSEENEMIQLWGKQMSYNNYVDVEAAYGLVSQFEAPVAAIIKHTNPCGAASDQTVARAFRRALAGDPVSAFGGIVAVNRPVDEETAGLIRQSFYECVIAPDFQDNALGLLKKKKNLRILKKKTSLGLSGDLEFTYLAAGLLVQQADLVDYEYDKLQTTGAREPSDAEKRDLFFAWKVVKHIKSNAIVFVRDLQVLGVGAGQMSRVDAVKLAGLKAREAGHNLKGAVMASDAFFPFRDAIDVAAGAGITAVIQPGGSVRDQQVIQAATEHGMAMLLTAMRHFKH